MLRRLERFLFYLFIFTLPFQTRLIFYQFGKGFNEWTSIYLYLTDILLITVFLLWFWRNRKKRYLKDFHLEGYVLCLFAFLLISFVSIARSANIYLGFYHWFKLLEMVLLFFYLKNNLYFTDDFDYDTFQEKFSFRHLVYVFILSGLFQSVIAILQYARQSSLGLKYLAESPLGLGIDGVANFTANGLKFIRVYGSFPHPNVLAGFLVTCLFFLYYLWFSRGHSSIKKYTLLVFYFLLLFALFLTYSRGVIAVFLLINLAYFHFQRKKFFRRTLFIFILLLIFCSLIFVLARPEVTSRFTLSSQEQSVSLRGLYNEAALVSIADYPILGLGMGNFVWEFRQIYSLMAGWIHQPVHNIYLLIASEIGLFGLVCFLLFLYFLLKKKPRFGLLLIAFLLIGLFDHFFWTLQQGQLLFWLVLGILTG